MCPVSNSVMLEPFLGCLSVSNQISYGYAFPWRLLRNSRPRASHPWPLNRRIGDVHDPLPPTLLHTFPPREVNSKNIPKVSMTFPHSEMEKKNTHKGGHFLRRGEREATRSSRGLSSLPLKMICQGRSSPLFSLFEAPFPPFLPSTLRGSPGGSNFHMICYHCCRQHEQHTTQTTLR